MPDRLLIRLDADSGLSWLAQDASGRALSEASTGAPPPATLAQARRIVVLVPSEPVLLLEAPQVSAQRAQLAKAVPFALEDQLASPVEDLHFALPERLTPGHVVVAVVARRVLRDWLAKLATHGIRADALVPETLALPLHDGAATLLIENDRALVRRGASQASACTLDELPDWLRVCGIERAEVYDFRAAPALALPIAVTRYHERQHDPLAFFAAQLAAAPQLNLLQGEFAPSHRAVPLQRLWRFAALLAGAALVLAFLYSGLDWLRLQHASTRLEQAERATLHSTFPEFDHTEGDPRQLMDSAIKRLSGGGEASGALLLIERIGPVLSTNTRVAVRSIEFHNATLELALRAPDVATLDLVRERIATGAGLKAEITSSTNADGGVDGRVRISGGKP